MSQDLNLKNPFSKLDNSPSNINYNCKFIIF